MVMFLTIMCMSLFGLALSALAFGAATREERAKQEEALAATVDARLAAVPERFFVHDMASVRQAAEPALTPRMPIDAILLQIERHVRLEQAAAESFLYAPSRESLHGRTLSPLVH